MLLSKSLKGLTHFHCIQYVVLLSAVHKGVCLFVTVSVSSFGFDRHICIVLCQRLCGSVRFPLPTAPPLPHTEQPLMDVESQRIKLKALDYPSQRSGDSDPVSAEDKHGNQTTRKKDDSSVMPADKLKQV